MYWDEDYDQEEEDMTDLAEVAPNGSVVVTLDAEQWLADRVQTAIVTSLVAKLTGMIEMSIQEAVEAKVLELADAKFAELAERLSSCERFAAQTLHDETRDGWLEDAAYFRAALLMAEGLAECRDVLLMLHEKADRAIHNADTVLASPPLMERTDA